MTGNTVAQANDGARASPRHIVWDWNGTLLDDNHAVVSAVNKVCAAFGRAPIDLDHWRSIFSRPLTACYERLLGRRLADDDWARLEILYHESYRELLHTAQLAPGVPDVLREWDRAGHTQSLLSMWFHDELVPLVTDWGLHSLFDRIDGLRAEIGGGSKSAHLEHHLTQQDIDPADVVLIGDVVDDAHTAQHAGTACVLLTTGVMARPALEETGYPVVDSIPEALRYLHQDA